MTDGTRATSSGAAHDLSAAPSDHCRVVVAGASAGGFDALAAALGALPRRFRLPVLVVQHLPPNDGGRFARLLGDTIALPVVEPCDKERIEGGKVYVAPANYHMLVEHDRTISLSVDAKVNWSRPAIDVLFSSAARIWGGRVVAVLLSGTSQDGTEGMRAIRSAGGLTLAQEPATAQDSAMPQAAIDADVVLEVLDTAGIGRRLTQLGEPSDEVPTAPARRELSSARGAPE